ncbi:hypothetical protein BGZ46_010805 [Entomortierella lignicola]|nr:hypothetical protein BGZ46_010805 [Entomortierella lignicola]
MRTRNQTAATPATNNTNKESKNISHESDNELNPGNNSDSDHDSSSTPSHEAITEYEQLRLENIRRNQEAMRMLSLPEAIAAVSSSSFRPDRNKRSAPTSTPGVKREKRIKNTELLPRRTSNRLANIEPDGPAATKKLEDYKETVTTVEEFRRARRAGILSLEDISGHGDESKFATLLAEMATYVPEKARVKDAEDESDNEETIKKEEQDNSNDVKEEEKDVKKEQEDDKDVKDVKKEEENTGIRKYFRPTRRTASNNAAATTPAASTTNSTTTASAASDKGKASQPTPSRSSKEPSLKKQVQALRIKGPWPTVKVCQGRVYCMAIHENKDKILVCGGDIDGNLGFWDLDEKLADDYEPEYDEEPNVYSYQAHTRTLSSMQYSPTDPTKLFTTSYDGSVRYLDLVKQKFMESYVVEPDASEHIGSISMDSNGQLLWFADNDGAVTLKDIRTPKDEMVYRKVLHEKKVGCVNVNPKYGHLIITSSLDRTMKIWDVRTFGQHKEEEPIPELGEFPHRLSVTSKSIASTSYDDYVRIFNNFEPGLPEIKEIPEPVRIHHNNQSGRWVTMLRAVWAHQFNWFSIGNMNKSVDIYSRGTGDLMANLKDSRILTTVPAVNAWHPSRVVIASGMANGKMVIWR